MYYELTHDRDKGMTYLGAYKKWENVVIPDWGDAWEGRRGRRNARSCSSTRRGIDALHEKVARATGFLGALGLLLAGLRLAAVVDRSWWLELFSLWGGLLLCVVVAFVVVCDEIRGAGGERYDVH